MTQPTAYTRSTAFADEESSNVGGRSTVRTGRVDAELDAVALTLGQVLTNLSIIQRDDTKLRDNVVELHTLSSAVLSLLSSYGATPMGNWLTATAYAYKDLVSQATNTYMCVTAHTSGTFATDLSAGKWILLSLGTSIGAGAVTFTPTATISATDVQSAINEADTENRALSAAASAAVASLVSDLSSTAAADKNAGQIGYLYSLLYAANTVGAELKSTGKVVSTIAQLKALLKTGNPRAFVLGYYAAGDGGGGAYYYDSTDTTTADNGGTVIVASDGGRWKMASTTVVSAKQYGAKGDGATNDYTAIQAWLDDTAIRKHYAPAGRYINSTSTWSVNRASVSLEGEAPCGQGAVTGSAITEFVANGPAVLMRWGDPAEASADGAHINAGGAIRNLSLTGSVASTSGLRVYNITVHIEDCYISNVVAAGGIGCWMKKAWGSTFTRNVIQSNAAVDLQLESANNSVGIYDNRFLSNSVSNGMLIKGGQNSITVLNNDFEGKLNGIKIDTSGATLENLTLLGNNFESNANRGISHTGGSNIIGLTIEGGRHNAANDGIDLDTVLGGRVDRVSLNNCNLNVNSAASVIKLGRSMVLSGTASYTGQVGALKAEATHDYLYEDNATVGALPYTLDASLTNELDLNLTAACTSVTFTINNTASRPRGARLSLRVGNSNTATAGNAVNVPAAFRKTANIVIPAANKKTTVTFEKDANNVWWEVSRATDAA